MRSIRAIGTELIAVLVPPWNRRDIYFYEERVYVRKGTNVFVATPDEIKRLHRGQHVG